MFDGVLCGEHEERLRQLESVFADSDLTLLHSLEQSTLHLCRSTVYLVGQHEVGKDGTLLYEELLVLLTVDHRADNVGRKQVGRKLNAAELGVNQLGQRLDSHCLSQTRHTFQQDMSVTEKTDEERFDEMLLSNNHLIHARHQIRDEATLSFYSFV